MRLTRDPFRLFPAAGNMHIQKSLRENASRRQVIMVLLQRLQRFLQAVYGDYPLRREIPVGGQDDICPSLQRHSAGKALQRLTVYEPDDGMIECAIEALKLVIPEEKGSDRW